MAAGAAAAAVVGVAGARTEKPAMSDAGPRLANCITDNDVDIRTYDCLLACLLLQITISLSSMRHLNQSEVRDALFTARRGAHFVKGRMHLVGDVIHTTNCVIGVVFEIEIIVGCKEE